MKEEVKQNSQVANIKLIKRKDVSRYNEDVPIVCTDDLIYILDKHQIFIGLL